ncbi:flavodoxin family protein [Listeria monocytogenes]|nr:flavodoxin family protein [Listeria monocytogenes]
MFSIIALFLYWLDDEKNVIEKEDITLHLLIINGSPRKSGATAKILTYIHEKLCTMDSELEITHIDLSNYNLKLCVGCMGCYKTGYCFIQDDGVERLRSLIDQCDGLILGSPTYTSNVSGYLKILMDRGYFIFEQLLRNKPCFSVITYENAGGKKAQKNLNEFIHYSGGSVSGHYRKKLNHGSEVLNKATEKTIDRKCAQYLVRAKRTMSLSVLEIVMRAIVFHVGLRRHAMKNPVRYKAVIDRWNNKGYTQTR